MGGRAVPHGHERADDDELLMRYIRTIERAVSAALPSDETPLVFAGVKKHFARYSSVNQHAGLLDEPLLGNHDHDSAADLRTRVWPLVRSRLEPDRDALLNHFHASRQQVRACSDLAAVVTASRRGAVETLLVDSTLADRPSSDPEARQLNQAVVETILHRGRVSLLDADQVSPVAAILRFPLSAATA
jgi:hypothetical protein